MNASAPDERSARFSVAVLLLSIAMLALATGLQGSLIGISASNAKFSNLLTGFVATGYPVGLLLGAWMAPRLIEAVGFIRVFAGFASLASSSAILVPLVIDPVWWFSLRVVTGICTAILYIICEAWLNAATTNRNRGRVMGLYMVITYSMMGIGQFLLNIEDNSGQVRFIVASVIMSFALVPITLTRVNAPIVVAAPPISLRVIYAASPLAFYTIFVNGLAQSALFGLGAVYGIAKGIPLLSVSLMIALTTLGVTLVQYPLGILSDHIDRRLLLLVVSASAGIAAAVAATQHADVSLIIAMFAIFGTLAIPTRSVALAHANDQLAPHQMLSASSRLFLIYGTGSSVGPLLVGGLMQHSGADAFMHFQAAVFGSVLLFAGVRMLTGPERRRSRQTAAGRVTPQSTPIATAGLAEPNSTEQDKT